MMRITIYYNQPTGGFTETWYQDVTSFVTDPATTWKTMFTKAIAFRGKGTTIYGCRQTVLAPANKATYFTKFNNKFVRPITDPSDQDPDVRMSDGLYYCYTVGLTSKKPIYLRGLVDGDVKIDANGIVQPTGVFTNASAAYFNAVFDNNFGMLKLDRSGGAPYEPHQVTLISPTPTNVNWTDLSLTTAMTGAVGDQVVFTGIEKNNTPGLPRVATIKAIFGAPAPKITIGYRFRASTATVSPIKMSVSRLHYTVQVTKTYQFWNFSEHKAGRIFGELRGRARAAIRAQ